MNNLQELMNELGEWQEKTFPGSNPISKLHHLAEEIPEVVHELELYYQNFANNTKQIDLEYADCFLLLLGSAYKYGMTADDVFRVVREKLEINKKRKWGKADENGVVNHIKEN